MPRLFLTLCVLGLARAAAHNHHHHHHGGGGGGGGDSSVVTVFTKDEVKAREIAVCIHINAPASHPSAHFPHSFFSQDCTRIRSPQLMGPTNTGTVHIIARCCGKNMCSSKPQALPTAAPREVDEVDATATATATATAATARRLDNDKDAKVIMKTSTDGGKTWGNLQTLSPHGKTHYANGAGLYDRVRQRLVVQYDYIPGGSTKPVKDATYFQITSSDDGKTWSAPRDITQQLAACNPGGTGNMQVQSAGSKVQAADGRLVWAGHDHDHHVCVWYSDDGGETYATARRVQGNEVSVAAVPGANQTLYMNGRQQDGWKGSRTGYWSYDNGHSWTKGAKSPLPEDDGGGCEGSVLGFDGALYFLEPAAQSRVKMVAHCSTDRGATWKATRGVNGDARGGYSDMVGLANGNLLAVWEDGSHPLGGGLRGGGPPEDPDSGNFYAQQLDTSWCK